MLHKLCFAIYYIGLSCLRAEKPIGDTLVETSKKNGLSLPLVVSMEEAAALVQDGMTLALGGLTLYRRPVGFVRALLQRSSRPRQLSLLSFTAGFESDLLVGAGCVKTIRTVYFGLEAFGLAPMFTDAAAKDAVHICEETEASIAMGLRAQAAGVGFMPSHAWIGTDLFQLRPDIRMITDPYTGETLTAFPAIPIDIAVLHGLEGDRYGNVKLNNNVGVDLDLIFAAKLTIATVETIVEQVVRSVDGVVIPAPGVTHIVEAPRGAYPTSCYPLYPVGGGELLRYIDSCNSGAFEEYLDNWLSGESE